MIARAAGITVIMVGALAAAASAQTVSGEAVYQRRCATCHGKPADGRTPSVDTLRAMTSTRILRALDFGAMMTIAYQLNRAERDAVASFLGKPGGDAPGRSQPSCGPSIRTRTVR
jgi:mono/diheme cytochrome c family protein